MPGACSKIISVMLASCETVGNMKYRNHIFKKYTEICYKQFKYIKIMTDNIFTSLLQRDFAKSGKYS